MRTDRSAPDGEGEATDQAAATDRSAPTDGERDRTALVAELERRRAEVERLRTSYVRARQSQYRRTAAGFALLGLLATTAGIGFPSTRPVLLALGGTGLFAAVLTWFVTPERFVSAGVGDAVYEALVRNHERLVRDLGLADDRIYVPTGDGGTGVRLFVPQHVAFRVPDADDLEDLIAVADDESRRGVSLRPTGETLFHEFEAALDDPLADDPATIVAQVRAGLVEQFEIASGLETDLDVADGRLSVRASDSPYGDLARFDHPVVSTMAVALARGLDRPVRVLLTTDDVGDLATLRWQFSTGESAADEGTSADASDEGPDATAGT